MQYMCNNSIRRVIVAGSCLKLCLSNILVATPVYQLSNINVILYYIIGAVCASET